MSRLTVLTCWSGPLLLTSSLSITQSSLLSGPSQILGLSSQSPILSLPASPPAPTPPRTKPFVELSSLRTHLIRRMSLMVRGRSDIFRNQILYRTAQARRHISLPPPTPLCSMSSMEQTLLIIVEPLRIDQFRQCFSDQELIHLGLLGPA